MDKKEADHPQAQHSKASVLKKTIKKLAEHTKKTADKPINEQNSRVDGVLALLTGGKPKNNTTAAVEKGKGKGKATD